MTNENSEKRQSTATIGFEQQIWEAADILRGNMDASEYKHVVLGLIFLKYISDKFDERYRELKDDDDDVEDKDAYTEANVFFVPPSARWSVISEAAHKENIGTVIDDAMRAIEKENKRLKDILPKNYARGELDKRRLGNVVDLFTNIQMIEHGSDKDILGRTYEYCLAKFAELEGKRAGEFFTPSCVVRTLVEVLQPFKGRVYDPCCGSGGMFVQSADFVASHGGSRSDISVYGQEFTDTTWKLAKMNLALRGIEADLGDHSADSFTSDLHKDLRADFVLANPPFNVSNWWDPSLADDPRWRYGTPPQGNANFAWVQHFLYHLSPTGTAGFVLANGSLSSKTSGEGDIRRKLVEADLVDCIVAMPDRLFLNTGIPVSLWFCSKDRAGNGHRQRLGEVLFIDARKLGRMETRRLRVLDEADIARIADTYHAWRNWPLADPAEGTAYADVPGFCKAARVDEIASHDFVLTPGRYVGTEEAEDDGEPIADKIARLTAELYAEFDQGRALEDEVRQRLGGLH